MRKIGQISGIRRNPEALLVIYWNVFDHRGSALKKTIGVAIGATILGLMVFGLPSKLDRARKSLPQSAYVWQRVWSEEVNDSVRQFAPQLDQIMVLAAEAEVIEERVHWVLPDIDWPVLAEASTPATLVFRIGSDATPYLVSTPTMSLASDVHEIWDSLSAEARVQGVNIAELQIDYDSPTGKLNAYRVLLNDVRELLPDVTLTITTLPTWMESEAFVPLVRTVDRFVLQVHSLEQPQHIDDEIELVSTSAIPAYLEAATKSGVPYIVALPTYGYDLIFDMSGSFVGIVADQQSPERGQGDRVRTIWSDPAALNTFANQLRSDPPTGCVGIAWFRLPVETDRLNWSRDTMYAVLNGQLPVQSPAVSAVEVRDDLYEIRLNGTLNTGSSTIAVILERNDTIIFADAMGTYNLDRTRESFRFHGRFPRNGEPIPIGWVRVEDGSPPPVPHIEVPNPGAAK